ncbi:MAG: hypothetical protein K8T90_00020 [Planctomycetes bacterium]|nr:hypothetical protein [Planctomycetota bacterium]
MAYWNSLVGRTAAVAVLVVVVAGPARAEQFKDEKLGYQLSYPKGWLKRPVAVDERWIVGKFECDREYESTDKKTGMFDRFRPWMDVVVLPLDLAKQKKKATVESGPGGVITSRSEVKWTNLREYLEIRLQEVEPGGFYFSKEEEATVNGYKVQQYEITVEKLVAVPKRVYAWAYATDDAYFCLISEAQIPYEDKLKGDILGAFRSFKAFPRTGALPNAATTGEDITVLDGKPKTGAEADKERKDAFDRRLRRVQDSVSGDKEWITRESDNFTAISHADAKYTKSVLDHAEALRAWLDEQLGYVGRGKPGKILIRICKDNDEYSALQGTGGFWSSDRVEIVTYRDREGWSNNTMSQVNSGIYDIWLRDKDKDFSYKMPNWIDGGLQSMVRNAVSKGRKIEFRPDAWDRVSMARAGAEGKLVQAKSFFTMTSDELYKGEGYQQAPYFVQYLMLGGAQKQAKFKDIFRNYMVELTLAVEEDRRKEKEGRAVEPGEERKAPENEQEEEAQLKARQTDFRKGEREFLDKLVAKVFEGWTFAEWDKLTKSYWAEVK